MKLHLDSLEIKSFVTLTPEKENAVRAGVGETQKLTYCAMPGGCTWYCSANCD
jgi:hypothetical protein